MVVNLNNSVTGIFRQNTRSLVFLEKRIEINNRIVNDIKNVFKDSNHHPAGVAAVALIAVHIQEAARSNH
jgi:hypothetical protein